MDRMKDSGSFDLGSIPSEATKKIQGFALYFFVVLRVIYQPPKANRANLITSSKIICHEKLLPLVSLWICFDFLVLPTPKSKSCKSHYFG